MLRKADRVSRILIGLLFGLVCGATCAEDLAIPPLTARVVDRTGTLDVRQIQTLEAELAQLERRKGAQVAVLLVPSTKPEDIAQYSIRVVDAWRLGRKNVDDGVLLIVAKDDHRVRIEVGRGLEGAIPDAAAARIIREYIAPKFRTGDYYGGLQDAIGALTKLIDGEPLPPPLTSEERGTAEGPTVWTVALFALLWARVFFALLPAVWRAGVVAAVAAGGVALIGGSWSAAVLAGLVGAFLGWLGGAGGAFAHRGGYGGLGGGLWGGGGFPSSGSGGGFSGGGGGFSGGGASGSW
jgi:uncharacterized protein